MIHMEKLTKFYGDFCAVDNIDLDIHKGEIMGLLGPNGAGKTTTLRMITGYLEPSSGSIKVKDFSTASLSPHRSTTTCSCMIISTMWQK